VGSFRDRRHISAQAVSAASVDVVLLHPAAQTRGGDAQIGGDVGDRLVTASSQLDCPLSELVWIALWHGDILPRDGSRRLMFGVR
jgi:hypothetical protein